MGRGRSALAATMIVAAGCVVVLPTALAASAYASSAHELSTRGGALGRTAVGTATSRRCHRTHKTPCSGQQSTQRVTGTSGGLTVTFTATQSGSTVTFEVASSETQAYGALGPEVLSFGNGVSEGFATPLYCLVDPVAESNDRQISYTYGATGSYTASVTVGANCTPDQLTLTLPITIG